MQLAPVTLEDRTVRLEPLRLTHLDDLTVAGSAPETWAYFACGPVTTREQMRDWIEQKLPLEANGSIYSFAIVLRATGRAVGSTSYLDVSRPDRRLEIGSTWLHASVRRSAVNTACKLLLLQHAFDTLGANRVQLKTDARNLRSQAAIERLGARREGVLRAHMVMWDGYIRDTVMYSVIAPEWPEVKQRLLGLLAR